MNRQTGEHDSALVLPDDAKSQHLVDDAYKGLFDAAIALTNST